MTVQRYQAWTAPFRRHPALLTGLRLLNRMLTYPIYIAYPCLLLWLVYTQDVRFWRVLLIPAISFVLLSVFRDKFNAPRPYEVLQIQPLIYKNTKGHSFPSRHVFSASIIASAFFYIIPILGCIVLACSLLLAVVRVLGGVHFPRDVIAGLFLGLAVGGIGFFL